MRLLIMTSLDEKINSIGTVGQERRKAQAETVLHLKNSGMTDLQIAQELCVTEKTVRNRKKLGYLLSDTEENKVAEVNFKKNKE